jgi:ribosomal protein L9
MQSLVNKNRGIIITPKTVLPKMDIDPEELKLKQLKRLQTEQLKNVKLYFRRPVSQINKQVVTQPVTSQDVLKELNFKYGMEVDPQDLQMANDLDSIGEHYITASVFSPQFEKDLVFSMRVNLDEDANAV